MNECWYCGKAIQAAESLEDLVFCSEECQQAQKDSWAATDKAALADHITSAAYSSDDE